MTLQRAPDQAARDRAISDLDTNMLVEAGAGSGKTTLMARRVVALIAAGRAPDSIAAVTFTRKAAAELRERIQLELEKHSLSAGFASEVFIGTIHSFCARLLRERPVEAGLDPRFRELDEHETTLLAKQWWGSWLERLFLSDDAELNRVRGLGVEPSTLRNSFLQFVRFPDVDLSAPEVSAPDVTTLISELRAFVKRGRALLPNEKPDSDWDPVQRAVLQLHFEQRSHDWSDPAEFFESLRLLSPSAKPTQIRWVRDPANAKAEKAAAKEFAGEFLKWRAGPAEVALVTWREHRYAPIARLLRRASVEFAQHRLRSARLSFEDLLLQAASLLRTSRSARQGLGELWRHLLVDEFQDTDPIQAEILFLLGSEAPPSGSADEVWSDARLRPGALFVVGDPKQSIYRFRRADIETYEAARRALERQGALLSLTANFRSLPAIAQMVNSHFGGANGSFPPSPTEFQAAFAPLEPTRGADEGDPAGGMIARYAVHGTTEEKKKDDIILLDAALVASWVASEIATGRITPNDVLILTRKKESLSEHARQLAARGIPVSVAGAGVSMEAELHELQLLLQLMRDPANPVLVAAVLEGRFFGASPADLWAAQEEGVALTITQAPREDVGGERATRVRDALLQIRSWLQLSHTHAPDVFLSRVLDETGLLVLTAASELGDVRAGLLIRLVEDVREASLDPERAGNAAHDALERLLVDDVPDAPLLPGRSDAVRVMNLHKAKGLEAEIVILASPTKHSTHEPEVAVRREGSRAVGGVLIGERVGNNTNVFAQPPGWAEMQMTESQFAAAEDERLAYVAATRARSRLLIAECYIEQKDGPVRKDDREWSTFTRTLDALAVAELPMVVTEARGRAALTLSAEELRSEATRVEAARMRAAAPSWVRLTVSEAAKVHSVAIRSLDAVPEAATGDGPAWGRAVHRVLESVGGAGDGLLTSVLAARVAEEEGIGSRAAELVATVQRVIDGAVWRALISATERRFEWPVAGWSEREGSAAFIEGVIDAAYLDSEGWHLIDWKTDAVSPEKWATRLPAYERQIATYAELLSRATNEKVTTRIVRVL